MQTCATGTPPAQTGGTIVDGTYAVTASVNYNCGDSGNVATEEVAETVVATGGCLQFVASNRSDAGTETFSASSSLSVSGNQITTQQQCPGSGSPSTSTYTATATTVTTLDSSGILVTLVKQ